MKTEFKTYINDVYALSLFLLYIRLLPLFFVVQLSYVFTSIFFVVFVMLEPVELKSVHQNPCLQSRQCQTISVKLRFLLFFFFFSSGQKHSILYANRFWIKVMLSLLIFLLMFVDVCCCSADLFCLINLWECFQCRQIDIIYHIFMYTKQKSQSHRTTLMIKCKWKWKRCCDSFVLERGKFVVSFWDGFLFVVYLYNFTKCQT